MKRTVKSAVFRYVIGLGLLLQQGLMLPAHAEIFKCTNKQGKIYYNDKPCPVDSDEKKIQNEKDPENGYVPVQAKSRDHRLSNTGRTNKKPGNASFYKPDQRDSDDETKVEDDLSGSVHKGVFVDPASRKKIPVKQFRNEGKKEKTRQTKRHPEPVNKRRADGKLSLNEKKALLGINSEPE